MLEYDRFPDVVLTQVQELVSSPALRQTVTTTYWEPNILVSIV